MASRLLLAAFPTLLLAFAVGAGASCGSNVDNYPALDGGLGAGTATFTTTTTSSGGTGGKGTGGATTTTTVTNTCAGSTKCAAVSDCPAVGTSCIETSCASGCCSFTKAPSGATCNDNGGKFCDGDGHCVACADASQCPASPSACATATCTAGACGTTSTPKGTPCTQGGTSCDGSGNCVNASCTDGMQDGSETDVDCGGTLCSPCADGKMCLVGTDCIDKVCDPTTLTCSAPTCSDGQQNGQETDVDCGGPTCPKCTNGETCQMNTDCASLSCLSNKCAAATCSDGIQNGTETDVDCGGSSCPPCAVGKLCGTGQNAGTNCVTKVCTSGTCQAPTCTDGVQNGDETDVDCGGGSYMGAAPCSVCNPGERCLAGSDCAGNNCQGNICQCPPGMLVVPIQGGGIYCIDAVEVTNAAYNTFIMANPSTANQLAYCSWNEGWTPKGGYPWPQQNGNFPVAYVNWCQAEAYCKYLGRRLCGKIGGGSASASIANDFTQDQWFNACTANDVNCNAGGCYPYGTTYNPALCNGSSTGTADFNTLLSCQGGSVGLYNMSGNVAEWEDSCSATSGPNDACAIRGGSYASDASGLRCDAVQTVGVGGPEGTAITREYVGPDVGFRCCL